MRKTWRLDSIIIFIEFVSVFIFLPLIFYLNVVSLPKIPSLLVLSSYCLLRLCRDSTLKCSQLLQIKGFKAYLRIIFKRFLPIAVVLFLLTLIFDPTHLFYFPQNRPWLWSIVIVLYPVFSALPQEIIYRAFFFQKYSKFLKNDNLIVISSALLFSYLHIIFHNPVAVIFTLIGGFFFC